MDIYQYNVHTKLYTGNIREARRDPKDHGNFLIPLGYTEIPLLTYGATPYNVFHEEQWRSFDFWGLINFYVNKNLIYELDYFLIEYMKQHNELWRYFIQTSGTPAIKNKELYTCAWIQINSHAIYFVKRYCFLRFFNKKEYLLRKEFLEFTNKIVKALSQ